MTRAMPFGAILAGGESRRYGSPKALAEVQGVPIIERVRGAIQAVLSETILIANEPELFAGLGLPTRRDVRRKGGVLAGIHTALLWAREADRPGVLAVACDMPFLEPGLLKRLLEAAGGDAGEPPPDAVLPESGGPRGVEPLCAFYRTTCIGPLEAALDRGDLRMIGFHTDIIVLRLPLAEVCRHGEPEHMFANVNTPAERDRAESMARRRRASSNGPHAAAGRADASEGVDPSGGG